MPVVISHLDQKFINGNRIRQLETYWRLNKPKIFRFSKKVPSVGGGEKRCKVVCGKCNLDDLMIAMKI